LSIKNEIFRENLQADGFCVPQREYDCAEFSTVGKLLIEKFSTRQYNFHCILSQACGKIAIFNKNLFYSIFFNGLIDSQA